MQSLFEWDFHDCALGKLLEVVDRNVQEFAPGLEAAEFMHKLAAGVVKHRKKLDLIIAKAAPEWPVEQIAMVDRNVLRLGLYELLFADKKEVPSRVAINEAIELAKSFGGDNSGRFVNGVLGAIYRELGEPGKEEVSEKKRRPKDVPYAQMPVEQLGGAVVFSRRGSKIFLAFVHDVFGYWTLSKGHLRPGESLPAGTTRIVKEELDLDIEVGEELGRNEYVASDPEQGQVRKQVVYFLARARNQSDLKLGSKGGLDAGRWFALGELSGLKMYDDVIPFVTKGIKLIAKPTAAKTDERTG